MCNLESNTLKWILTGSVKAAASAPSEDAEAGSDVAPTAPEDTDPSAPVETFQSAECVICLERKVAFSSFLGSFFFCSVALISIQKYVFS